MLFSKSDLEETPQVINPKDLQNVKLKKLL